MLAYFRKWTITLKRRRLKNQRAKLQQYLDIETNTRGDGSKCYNCGAPLTGPFCHICGQRDDDLRRPIWTFLRELFNAIFDTDSKVIKTIILLIAAPGALSRAFMEGKRARYLPPFRLYVVLLFVFFSTLSLANVLIIDIHVTPKAANVAEREALEAQAARLAEEITQNTLEGLKIPSPPDKETGADDPIPGIEPVEGPEFNVQGFTDIGDEFSSNANPNLEPLLEAIGGLRKGDTARIDAFENAMETFVRDIALGRTELNPADLERAQKQARALLAQQGDSMVPDARNALQGLLAINPQVLRLSTDVATVDFSFDEIPYNFDVAMFVPNDNTEREGIKQEDIDFILGDDDVPEIVKKATEGFAEGLKSPREFNKLFNEWLPLALVILMPVFALILRLTHWGKRRYYLNQLVFALHFHSFLFVMLTVFAFIVPLVGGESAFDIFWWGTSAYLIIALKIGQNQGWFRAFFKAGFIWVSYFGIMMWTMLVVMFMGVSDTSLSEFWTLMNEAKAEIEQGTPPAQSDEVDTPQ